MSKKLLLQQFDKPPGPLADRMRPKTLDEFVGQEHLVGRAGILRTMLITDRVSSVVFWGPPGIGKTTLGRLIAEQTKSRFVKFSAVTATLDEIRQVIKEARELYTAFRQRTILFIDEIHRFNKLQQDAFLPSVEDGTIILIGATTENPSFEIISALLSRTKVFVLKPLEKKDLNKLLKRALTDSERGLGNLKLTLDEQAQDLIVSAANGDARTALNLLEDASVLAKAQAAPPTIPLRFPSPGEGREKGRGQNSDSHPSSALRASRIKYGTGSSPARGEGSNLITADIIASLLQHQILRYDKGGDEHYNTISAFIKSMRASDPNAALYYLARMIHGGENPLFIARRMVVFASEDVGLADEHALPLAIACMQAVDFVGMPEGRINLAHCAVYLALAPKSNASYTGLNEAMQDVEATLNEPIPAHLLNAPTELMRKLGYGKGYKYAHDYAPEELKGEQYLPDKLKNRKYFRPKN